MDVSSKLMYKRVMRGEFGLRTLYLQHSSKITVIKLICLPFKLYQFAYIGVLKIQMDFF